MSETVWGLVSVLALGGVAVIGLPFLARGGGLLRGGRRKGRSGDRIRVGPSALVVLMTALLRRLDTVLLVLATGAVVVLVVLNARA